MQTADDKKVEQEVERRRVQIDFSPKAHEQLLNLKEMAGATSIVALIRNALRFFEWYLQQKKNGYTLQLAKGDSVKEVEIVF